MLGTIEVFEARNSIPDLRIKFQVRFFVLNPKFGSKFLDSSVQKPKLKENYLYNLYNLYNLYTRLKGPLAAQEVLVRPYR